MLLLFLVVKMGFKCYSMLFHHVCIPIIPKYKNGMYLKNYYEYIYCHMQFHICIDMRTHCIFDISVNDLQHDLVHILIFV